VLHGGYASVSIERIEQREREIIEALAQDTASPDVRDFAALRLAAQAMCRLEDVRQHIDTTGAINPKTREVRPAVEIESKLRTEAARHLHELGLSPSGRQALGVDVPAAWQPTRAQAEEYL
jgi:hypothetical protein